MTRLSETATGVFVIAVTPFTEDGSLDLDSLDRAVDFYFAAGADGLTVLGMMGEAPKLTADEAQTVVRRVLARAEGRPIVVGVSAPGLAAIRQLSAFAMDAGAAGVMVAPPASIKTDPQVVGYYRMVAEILDPGVPIVVQDFPLGTQVHISLPALLEVFETVPTCVMLKHEDWPGLAKIGGLRAASDAGRVRRMAILCGNGGLFLPEELDRGADGAMTGFAYPEMMVTVTRLHLQGERERLADIFDAYLPLARYEQQPGLGLSVRKHVMQTRGIIASAALRRPAPQLSPADLDDVARLLSRQEARLRELGA